MARFRLRFLLQEIDLPAGETLVGRSGTCHVTIEDPLVSREHARIRISGDQATIEDLGSRNGLQVNGVSLRRAHELKDGDRIRIGTQEMVFFMGAAPSPRGPTRTTGFMCYCAMCGHPYPQELVVCPACGSTHRRDDDPLASDGESTGDWGLSLAVEAMERARAHGRLDDLDRLLEHARIGIERRMAVGLEIDRPSLDIVAAAAATFAAARGDATWARWLLSVYAAIGLVPPAAVSHVLTTLPAEERSTLSPVARLVLEGANNSGGGDKEERENIERMQALVTRGPVGA